jgi:hypothetical protein
MGGFHSAEYYRQQLPPCANCGKENLGFMGSTEWGHNHSCCSNACGIRLGNKIKNGMTHLEPYGYFGNVFGVNNDERIELMRMRIDQLKNQLKVNGIKPVR